MYSFVLVLVAIFIYQGSSASLSSLGSAAEVSSQQNASSNINISTILNSLVVTENGLVDLDGLVQILNLTSSVNTKDIISRLNLTTSQDGPIDFSGLVQTFNITNVNTSDVLGLLNVSVKNGVLDFTNLVQHITSSGGLTGYLNSVNLTTTEEARLNFKGLVNKYIGTVEEYNVTTEVEYILKVFRIPGDTSKMVLLSHGLLCSSDDFILQGNTSLAYVLAQKGYDVWVTNYRGNRYSQNHQTLDPNTDDNFWWFSMQEFGYYDLSAVIDFVLNKTGQEKLSMLGHSKGTAAAFVLLSTRPEYNDKIKIFVALSHVCYISASGQAMTVLLRTVLVFSDLLRPYQGFQELMRYESNARRLFQLFCSQGIVGYDLCLRGLIGALLK